MAHRKVVQVGERRIKAAVELWVRTPISKMHELIPEGADVYLVLVSEALSLPYDVIKARFDANDEEVLEVRGLVHDRIQRVLHEVPASIIQTLDDAVLADEAVKSSNA